MFDPGDNSRQDSRITSAIVVAGGIVCALLPRNVDRRERLAGFRPIRSGGCNHNRADTAGSYSDLDPNLLVSPGKIGVFAPSIERS